MLPAAVLNYCSRHDLVLPNRQLFYSSNGVLLIIWAKIIPLLKKNSLNKKYYSYSFLKTRMNNSSLSDHSPEGTMVTVVTTSLK